jgi:hypothetical protein
LFAFSFSSKSTKKQHGREWSYCTIWLIVVESILSVLLLSVLLSYNQMIKERSIQFTMGKFEGGAKASHNCFHLFHLYLPPALIKQAGALLNNSYNKNDHNNRDKQPAKMSKQTTSIYNNELVGHQKRVNV